MADVEDVPDGVAPALWAGSAAAEPAVGDMWLLSWNHETAGLALVSGVGRDFALTWPVTLPSQPAFPPALSLPGSPLGTPVNIWPTRETGVGFHMFDRQFGQLIAPHAIAAISDAIDENRIPDLPYVESDLDAATIADHSDRMIDAWEGICLNTWPELVIGASPLAASVLDRAGLDIAAMQELLHLTVPEAVALYRGELIPTEFQIDVLATAAEVDPFSLLVRQDEALRTITSPTFKRRFAELAIQLGTEEGRVRDMARQDLALAARSDGTLADRLTAVLDRLEDRSASGRD